MNRTQDFKDFLEDLRVGDIIFELETLKNQELTKIETSGAVLLFLAENFDREHLIEALRFDDMEFLEEILSKEILRLQNYNNPIIKSRFIFLDNTVSDIVSLIHNLGSYEVRMAMDLLDEEDITEFEDEQQKRVNIFLRILSKLKKDSLTESEKLGIYLLMLFKIKGMDILVRAIENEDLILILKEEIDKIRKNSIYKKKYKNSKNIIEETLDLIYNKIGKEEFKEIIIEHLIDIEVDEEILFS